MPDHVKKILNRAYLEYKPYNDIVLHLEREMRLNGLGAPDETTLVPLNTVDAVMTEDRQKKRQRGYYFHCGKYGHLQITMPSPPQRKVLRQKDDYRWTQNSPRRQNPNATIVKKCTKRKIVGTDPMRQMIPAKRNVNSPSQPTKSTDNLYPPRPPSQKTDLGKK